MASDNAAAIPWKRSFAAALFGWLASRAIFTAIGAYSYIVSGHPVPWSHMWVQWDAWYYLNIAQHGYMPPTAVTGLETGQSNLNFFPLLPIGIALLNRFIASSVVSGLVFTNLCLAGAAFLAHRLMMRRGDLAAADWTVIAMMVLPGSFELSGVSTEAPYLLLSLLTVQLALDNRLAGASVSSACLSVTRLTGILQGAGMALDWMLDRSYKYPASYRRLFFLALIPMPLLVTAAYMFYLTGDALAPQHSAFAFWNHNFVFPFRNFAMIFWTNRPELQIQSVIGSILLAAIVWQWRMFSIGEWFFILLSIVGFASDDSASPSLIRYMISLYPLHLAVGRLCASNVIARGMLFLLALASGAIAISWFHGGNLYV